MNWSYEKKMINVTFEENKIMLLWQKSNNHPSIQKGFFFLMVCILEIPTRPPESWFSEATLYL